MKNFVYMTIAAVAAAAAQAAEVTRVKSNAETALIQSFDPGANSFTQLDLSRNVTKENGVTTVTAFLIVQSNSCNFPNCSGFNGSGPIPNGDFEGGSQEASLHTNTAANPDFTLIGFTRNLETGEETTFPMEGGIMEADWTATDFLSFKTKGSSITRQPTMTVKTKGESNLTSAEASGSVLGNPLATPNSGLIGTNHNRETTIIRE